MSNSSLVSYTKLSPNHSGKRTMAIDRITPHCVVGQCTISGLGDWFARSSTQASSNYGIDKDGKVGLFVDEGNRSWCSSSNANDQRAVTIECASDTSEPYAFRDVVYRRLIDLCADICKRNGKTKLLWMSDKNAALNYSPKSDEMVLTVHRWFANKSCPGNWLYSRMHDLANEVTTRLSSSSTQTKCYANRVIEVAVAELGYHEKASNSNLDDKTANSGSANFTKYARDFDEKFPRWYNGKKNGYAWCDMFVDWCHLTAYGYENALRLLCQPEKSCGAGCTYSLQYYREHGQFYTSGPKIGDQIFFGTSLSNSTHTGLVEKVENGVVYTIEGNTSDCVARRSYALSNSTILGYGRPNYDVGTDTTPIPSNDETQSIKVGDTVKIVASGDTPATYYRGQAIPGWVASTLWIVRAVSGDRIVIDKSADGRYSICSPIAAKFLQVVTPSDTETPFTPYLVRITATVLNIRSGPGTDNNSVGAIYDKGVYTIVAEAAGKGATRWGKLKSGAGWISLDYTVRL